MKCNIIFNTPANFSVYNNEDTTQLIKLNDASKINILIGANNSGKSRFIRLLLEDNLIFIIEKILILINDFNTYIKDEYVRNRGKYNAIKDLDLTQFEDYETKITFKQFVEIDSKSSILDVIHYNKKVIALFQILNTERSGYNNYFNFTHIDSEKLILLSDILDKISSTVSENLSVKIFIPTLRTAHSIFQEKEGGDYSKISRDIYKDTIIKNYNLKGEDIEIFTGLDLYYQIVNIRNDVKDKRESFEKFEGFLSQNFFNGKKIEIVAKFNIYNKHQGKDDSELINLYIDGTSNDLHELGDGIQALFILMYKIYTCKNKSIIFIDEPEINLHPGMQRLFLDQITTNQYLKEKDITYFISTHSNHFLDLTIEKNNISIFLFNKNDKNKFIVKNVNHGDNSTLQYLGVTNSSVFLANCSIWVEGISDRNYLKAFLKAYCKANANRVYPKEDIEFAFIEYAGSNIDHYNFDEVELKEKINAFSINNKIFLISDYDGPYKDEKHAIYKEIEKENDNFKYQTTKDYREIENLLPFSVWDKILINFCDKRRVKTEKDIERVQAEISNSLKKKKTENYKTGYIGKLLKNIKTNVPELNKIWDKTEGTLMNKSEVSFKVLELTDQEQITWDDFKTNPKIVSIVQNLYDFIQKSNYR
ncbi:AAA family ATPase [Chryseobacterium arthrosphaerae]|uniref:AAA family ATPase n=1 Tax=Chryseobacterium arthrosphaerae TaxID=651561 RepID=UPI0031E0A167